MSQSVKDEETRPIVLDNVESSNVEEDQRSGPETESIPADIKRFNNVSQDPSVDIGVETDDVKPDNEKDAEADADSEAETLIQSPEKKKAMASETPKVLYQLSSTVPSDTTSVATVNASDKENTHKKRKRSEEGLVQTTHGKTSRHSSPLSSPMPQAISTTDSESDEDQEEVLISGHTGSEDEEDNGDESPETFDRILKHKKRRRPSDLATSPSAQKRPKRASSDILDKRKTRSATYPENSDDSSSPDPPTRREHRRGASTQIPVEGERKRRGRPPNILTRRNISVGHDSNSDDDSEHAKRPRSTLQKLVSNDHDAMSPAKVGPRKWKDKNGRTYLARACAAQDLDLAKQKFEERPGDLNMADNAGNTPLQIASLEGYEDIVEFLLSKGADVNVRNLDKDTPLIDSVENGHVEVIKLLLAHGANPRMGNAKGDEPFELVPKDDENFEVIRRLLADAKDRANKRLSQDESEHGKDGTSSRAPSATSPRESPPTGLRSPPAAGSRRRTGRSESTRNDLLWAQNTPESLVKLSAKGDVQGVAGALEVIGKASTEAVIAAAKAGHYEALNMLIAIGNPVTDPQPVQKFPPGYSTPLLAAIGRGHPDVVKLLVTQSGFNPTKRFREKTYFELAEDRKGSKWEEEYSILKDAYDKYNITRGRKTSSPRRSRDDEKARRSGHRSPSTTSSQRMASSPETTHKSKHKGDDIAVIDEIDVKQSEGGDKRNELKAKHRSRRSQSDLPPVTGIEGDAAMQKRRRLMTGKEHRNRHTISTSSDNEMPRSAVVQVKQEELGPPVLKRTRDTQSPDIKNDGKDIRKKRRTIPDSSPEEPRVRSSDTTLADTETEQAIEGEPSNIASKNPSQRNEQMKTDQATSEPTTVISQHPQEGSTVDVDARDFGDSTAESRDIAKSRPLDLLPPPRSMPPADVQKEATDAQEEAERERKEREAVRRREELAREELAREEAAREEQRQKELEAIAKAEAEAIKQMEHRRRLAELEAERQRIDALPVVLAKTAQMIDDADAEVKSPEWLSRFIPLYTAKTQQLDPDCEPTERSHTWIPNFQAACLLCTKDLGLLDFTSFNRRPATEHERRCLWRVARNKLSYDFNPAFTSIERMSQLDRIGQQKFMAMPELFWIRLSDFMDQIPRFPHLNDLHLHTQPISLKSYSSLNLNSGRESMVGHKPVLLNGMAASSMQTGIIVNGDGRE